MNHDYSTHPTPPNPALHEFQKELMRRVIQGGKAPNLGGIGYPPGYFGNTSHPDQMGEGTKDTRPADRQCDNPDCICHANFSNAVSRCMSKGEMLAACIIEVCKSLNMPQEDYYESWQQIPEPLQRAWDLAAEKFIEPESRRAANWEESARSYCKTAEEFRAWLEETGKHLGPKVYLADDGSYMGGDILIAKVPDMVKDMAADHLQVFGSLQYLCQVIAAEHPEFVSMEGNLSHANVVAMIIGGLRQKTEEIKRAGNIIQGERMTVRDIRTTLETVYDKLAPAFGTGDLPILADKAVTTAQELKRYLSAPVLCRLVKLDNGPLRVVLTPPNGGPEASLDVSWPAGDIVHRSIQAVVSEQKRRDGLAFALGGRDESFQALQTEFAKQHDVIQRIGVCVFGPIDAGRMYDPDHIVGNVAAAKSSLAMYENVVQQMGLSVLGTPEDPSFVFSAQTVLDGVTDLKEQNDNLSAFKEDVTNLVSQYGFTGDTMSTLASALRLLEDKYGESPIPADPDSIPMEETRNLSADLKNVQVELDEAKRNYEGACKTIAKMHAALFGVVTGPMFGVVEDMAMFRNLAFAMADRICETPSKCKEANEFRSFANPAPAVESGFDDNNPLQIPRNPGDGQA